MVKGTGSGTTTDGNGKLGIATSSKGVLVFSYIGFKSQEIAVGSRSSIDVSMEEDALKLQKLS